MPRPFICRRVQKKPDVDYFKPAGIRLKDIDNIVLTVDEFEAIRLKDYRGLEQKNAAENMQISQPTFNRLIRSARKKVADSLVNGKAIKIQGGIYKIADNIVSQRGAGRGRMGGRVRAGPGGLCICPKCKNKQEHVRGVPCYEIVCQRCGSKMVRG